MNFFHQYDDLLTADELALVDRAGNFCSGDFATAAIRSHSANAAISAEWTEKWSALGMLGLQARREDGGQAASYMCKIRVAQEMAQHSYALAFCLNHHQGQVTRVSSSGSAEQKADMLSPMLTGARLCTIAMTEPGGGSDVAAMQSVAIPVEGGWLLNGAKSWVTNGMAVTDLYVLAHVGAPAGTGSIASFFVSLANGATAQRREIDVPGARAFGFAEITFKDHFIPTSAMVNKPGDAFKASMGSVNSARVHVAAMSVASLYSALRVAASYCEDRQAFGKPLVAHQGLRWELAEVATRLEAANALVFRAAAMIQNGETPLELAAQSKKFAIDTAIWGIDQCIRIVGAVGTSSDLRLNMLFSEVRMSAFGDGTNQMLQDRIGRGLSALYPPYLQ